MNLRQTVKFGQIIKINFIFKLLFFIQLSILFTLETSLAKTTKGGVIGGGGGDGEELKFFRIREDLLTWIQNGGARKLKFESSLRYQDYIDLMKEILDPKEVVITFVDENHPTDVELQVTVDSKPKTCRGFESKKDLRPHILCHRERFRSLSEVEKYRLVHHEYAGLVSIEKNDGALSDYYLSNQLDPSIAPFIAVAKKLDDLKNDLKIKLINELQEKGIYILENGWIGGLTEGIIQTYKGKLVPNLFLSSYENGLSLNFFNSKTLNSIFNLSNEQKISSNAELILEKIKKYINQNAAFNELRSQEKKLLILGHLTFIANIADFTGFIPNIVNLEEIVTSEMIDIEMIKNLNKQIIDLDESESELSLYFDLSSGDAILKKEMFSGRGKTISKFKIYNQKICKNFTWKILKSYTRQSQTEDETPKIEIYLDIKYGSTSLSPRFGVDSLEVILPDSKNKMKGGEVIAKGHTLLSQTFGDHVGRDSFFTFGSGKDNAVHIKVGIGPLMVNFFEALHLLKLDLRRPKVYTPSTLLIDKDSLRKIKDSNELSTVLDKNLYLGGSIEPDATNDSNPTKQVLALATANYDLFLGDLLMTSETKNGWIKKAEDVNDLDLYLFGTKCFILNKEKYNTRYSCLLPLSNKVVYRVGENKAIENLSPSQFAINLKNSPKACELYSYLMASFNKPNLDKNSFSNLLNDTCQLRPESEN